MAVEVGFALGVGRPMHRAALIDAAALTVALSAWSAADGCKTESGEEAVHQVLPAGGGRGREPTGKVSIHSMCPRPQLGQSRNEFPVSLW